MIETVSPSKLTSTSKGLSEKLIRKGRCLTWHMRFSATLKRVDAGCKFREIRTSFSLDQRHSMLHDVLSCDYLAVMLTHEAGFVVL